MATTAVAIGAVGVAPTEVTMALSLVLVVVAAPVTCVAIGVAPETLVVVAPVITVPVITPFAAGGAVELGVPMGVSSRAKPVVVVGGIVVVVVGTTVVGTGVSVLLGGAGVPGSVAAGTPAGGIVARVLAGAVVGVTLASAGALDLRGTGAPSWPPKTYTAIPSPTCSGNHWAEIIGMRTHPCEAGVAGTEGAPWMAMPPLKYSGL